MYSYEMESNRKVWTIILRTINGCNKIYIHLNGPRYIYIYIYIYMTRKGNISSTKYNDAAIFQREINY
jgi:hypothetical protein